MADARESLSIEQRIHDLETRDRRDNRAQLRGLRARLNALESATGVRFESALDTAWNRISSHRGPGTEPQIAGSQTIGHFDFDDIER